MNDFDNAEHDAQDRDRDDERAAIDAEELANSEWTEISTITMPNDGVMRSVYSWRAGQRSLTMVLCEPLYYKNTGRFRGYRVRTVDRASGTTKHEAHPWATAEGAFKAWAKVHAEDMREGLSIAVDACPRAGDTVAIGFTADAFHRVRLSRWVGRDRPCRESSLMFLEDMAREGLVVETNSEMFIRDASPVYPELRAQYDRRERAIGGGTLMPF